jgi:protein SCO1
MRKFFKILKQYPILPIIAVICVGIYFSLSFYQNTDKIVKIYNPDADNIRTNLGIFSLTQGDFTLTNQDKKPVTLSQLYGKPTLMYFGFTHCPDYCPTALGVFDAVDSILGDNKINRIFVSVDPMRDTPDVLKQYASLYKDGLITLTGTPEQVDAVAKLWRIFYSINKKSPDDMEYTVDHVTYMYILNAQGKLVAMAESDTTPDKIAELITKNNL